MAGQQATLDSKKWRTALRDEMAEIVENFPTARGLTRRRLYAQLKGIAIALDLDTKSPFIDLPRVYKQATCAGTIVHLADFADKVQQVIDQSQNDERAAAMVKAAAKIEVLVAGNPPIVLTRCAPTDSQPVQPQQPIAVQYRAGVSSRLADNA